MKKRGYLLWAMLLCLSLTGCRGKAGAPEKQEEAATQEAAKEDRKDEIPAAAPEKIAERPSAAPRMDLEVWIEEKNNFEDWDVMSCNYDLIWTDSAKYPELAKTLEAYSAEQEESILAEREELVGYAREAKSYNSTYFSPYEIDVDLQVRRADSRVLSLREYTSSYSGGAHGSYETRCMNLDPETGRELALSDVVSNPAELAELIIAELHRTYGNEEGAYNMGHEDLIRRMFGGEAGADEYQAPWSIGYNEISVYFDHYVLGPYAAGEFHVAVPFSAAPELFYEEYRETPEEYVAALDEYMPCYVDLDGDGNDDTVEVQKTYRNVSPGYADSTYEMIHILCNGREELSYENYGSFTDFRLLKLADGRCYLYVQWYGGYEGEDYIEVFEMRPGAVRHAGNYFGDMSARSYEKKYELTDPGCFYLSRRGNEVMGTYQVICECHVGADGLPVEEGLNLIANPEERDLTAKIPVNVYLVSADGTEDREPTEIPAGTVLTFYGTKGDNMVEMVLEDGRHCRIYIDSSEYPHTIDGIAEDECFDGIMYAG